MVKRMNEVTEKQFEKAKKQALFTEFHKYHPVEHPQALLVCGQPGAGKTYLIEHLNKKNFAFINGDVFRSYHPYVEELKASLGEGYIEATRKFNGKMTEAIIDELSDKKYNLIIEGTMRTTEVPLKTKQLLEGKGYEVSLNVLVVRPEVSYLRAQQRYLDMKRNELIPRKTDAAFQKSITDGLSKNLETLYTSGHFSEICLYKEIDKQLTCIYSSKESPHKHPGPILEAGHKQKFTMKEIKDIKALFPNVVSEETFKKLFKGRVQKGLSKRNSALTKERM